MEKVLAEYEELVQECKRLQASEDYYMSSYRHLLENFKELSAKNMQLESKYADLEAENRRLLEAEAERLEYPTDVEVVDLRARVEGYERRRQEMLKLLQREV